MESGLGGKTVTAKTPGTAPSKEAAPAMNNAPAVEAAPAAKRLAKPLRIGLISLAAVVLAAAVGLSLYGAYGYDRIYQGVFYDGNDLSGLTRQEAAALLDVHISAQAQYPSQTLTARIDGRELSFGAENTGAHIVVGSAAAIAAEAAYQAGREGGYFSRLGSLLGGHPTELEALGTGSVYINKELIFNIISEITEDINTPAVPMGVERTGDSLVFTRPQAGRFIDPYPITELVARRLEELDFAALSFSSDEVFPEEPDLNAIRADVYEPATDAEVAGSPETGYSIQPHQYGADIDLEPARAWLSDPGGADTLSVDITRIEPDVTQQMMQNLLFRDELGRAQTDYAGSNASRKHNIALASEFCNGWILLPGDQFSYSAAVGLVTEANGYQKAGGYRGGKLVDDMMGGGMCQVTSTIYYAALLADLKIVKRLEHQLTVAYIPLGLDATFATGGADLVIENDKTYPIQIIVTADGRKNTVTIIGTKENDYTITMERFVLSETPYQTVYVDNPLLPPGSEVKTIAGHSSYRVETFRVLKDSAGNEISRTKEANSSYRRVDAVIERGPPLPEPQPLPATPEPPPVTPAPEPVITPEPDLPPPETTPEPETTPWPETLQMPDPEDQAES